MAGRYAIGLEQLGQAKINLLQADLYVILLDANYVPNLATDANYTGIYGDVEDGWLARPSDKKLCLRTDPEYATVGGLDKSHINNDVSGQGSNNPAAGTGVVAYCTSPLSSKTLSAGYLDASDPFFSAVPGSKTITQIVLTALQQYPINGGGSSPPSPSDTGYNVWKHVPLALLTHDTTNTPISYATGGGGDLIVRWENVSPWIFQV